MNSKSVFWFVLGAVVVVLLLMLAPESSSTPLPLPEEETEGYVPESIEAFHSFDGSTHMLFGSVDLPTPCYSLDTNVVVAESYPEQITVEFVAEVDADIMCTQVISPSAFSIEVDASEEATFKARFNGVSVPFSIN